MGAEFGAAEDVLELNRCLWHKIVNVPELLTFKWLILRAFPFD